MRPFSLIHILEKWQPEYDENYVYSPDADQFGKTESKSRSQNIWEHDIFLLNTDSEKTTHYEIDREDGPQHSDNNISHNDKSTGTLKFRYFYVTAPLTAHTHLHASTSTSRSLFCSFLLVTQVSQYDVV